MALNGSFHALLQVWRYREYALFMGGQAPSLMTLWMQRVGVGWLAWELTHSPAWLGAVAAADLAPMIVLAPFAGALTDRGNPLTQARIAQVLFVVQAITMATFTLTGLMTIELLFGLSLVSGTLQPLSSTARFAIVPATVPREVFATAIATDSALFNASRFIGPALAGLMIPFAGVGGTFVVHAVGCTVFSSTLAMMRLAPPDRKGRRANNILAEVGESFAYISRHPGIGPLFLMLTAVSICIRPMQDMLPGFAGSVFNAGPVGLAWLTSAMGVGALSSALWIAMRGRIAGLTRRVLLGCLGLAVSVFGFVATDLLWVSIAFSALAGFTFNLMTTGTQTLVQSSVDDDLRGRIMGTYTLIYRGTPAFGALAVGALAETIGLRMTLGIAAAVTLAAWALTAPRRRAITAAVEAK
jgi:MFS family permease